MHQKHFVKMHEYEININYQSVNNDKKINKICVFLFLIKSKTIIQSSEHDNILYLDTLKMCFYKFRCIIL